MHFAPDAVIAPNVDVPQRAADRGRSTWGGSVSWLVLMAVVATVAGIRLHLAGVPLERDEGEYAYAGQQLLDGNPPYRDVYNMKFPGTYVAYAGILRVFGQSIRGVHRGTALVNAVDILLVFLLARRLWPGCGRRACEAAGAFALLSLDPRSYGLAGHATHFVLLPALAGLLLLPIAEDDPATPGRTLLAGVMFGLAILMKQPGGVFAGLGLVWIFGQQLRRRAGVRSWVMQTATYVAGVLAPLAATALWLRQAGVYQQFWFWTIDYARRYAGEQSLHDGWIALRAQMALFLQGGAAPVWCLAAAGWLLGCAVAVHHRPLRPVVLFVTLMLAFSAVGVCGDLFFRPHYFILLMPALGLAVAVGDQALATMLGTSGRAGGAAAAMVPALLVVLGGWFLYANAAIFFLLSAAQVCRGLYGDNLFVEAVTAGRYLQSHSSPGDTIAVMGSEPEIFFYAHRRSATGFIYVFPLMEPQPYALQMQQQMAGEIQASQPAWLVLTLRNEPSWFRRPGSVTWILGWLEQYRQQFRPVAFIPLPGSPHNAQQGSGLLLMQRRS